MKTLVVKSYAKINLALNVKGVFADGYHDLDMINLPLELHDTLLINNTESTGFNTVTMDDYSLGTGFSKTAVYGIDILQKNTNYKNKTHVMIHKVIPMKAGLGGGSSNTSFIMKAINSKYNLGLSNETLAEMSLPIGSDCPFFIYCKPARVQGRGEVVKEIPFVDYYVLLVKPEKGCSTKEIYDSVDPHKCIHPNIDKIEEALKNGNEDELSSLIGNSLQETAAKFVPEINQVIKELKEYGFKIVSMTGSGSSVFALTKDKKFAKKAEKYFDKKYKTILTKTLK